MSDDKYAQKLELLRQELAINFDPPSFFPRGAIDEIYYALSPPVHEGRYPPFGAIFTPYETLIPTTDAEPWALDVDIPIPNHFAAPKPSRLIELSVEQVEQARMLADGRTTFIVRTPTAVRLAYFQQDVGTEFVLSSLVSKTLGSVVQRDRSGLVRLFTLGAVHYHKERRWKSEPSMDGNMSHLLIEPPVNNFLELMPSLLHLAYYHLSTAGVGATLIWCLHDRVLKKHSLSDKQDVRWARLNVTNRQDMPSIANLLAQKDLATLIDPLGNVVAVGVELKPQDSGDLLPKHSGSRHNSAQGYSFDEHEAVVVMVSADGPVKVFTDGALARSLVQYGKPVGDAKELPLTDEKCHSPWHQHPVDCPSCKKPSLVYRQLLSGHNVRQEVLCPVCKHPLAEAECFRMQARLVKYLKP